jgi:hypothetical protein
MMSKFLGVASLWVCLITLPHVTPPSLDEAYAGETIQTAAMGDDPGDPFRLAAALPARAENETPAEPAERRMARVHFKNDLDKTLTLVEAQFTMDGKQLPIVSNLKVGGEVILFTGPLAPGPHIVKTRLLCQANKRGGGIFSYMDKYKLNIESDEVLTMPDDRSVQFTVIAHRNKGINVPFEKQVEVKAAAADLPDSNGPRSLRN